MELDLSKLLVVGFKRVRRYEHDQFTTYIYEKGFINVEITFEGQKLVSKEFNITIDGSLDFDSEKTVLALDALLN